MHYLLARLAIPLTFVLWAMVIVGMADHFFGPFLPPKLVEFGLIALWLVAALTWFGFRQRKRDESRPPPGGAGRH